MVFVEYNAINACYSLHWVLCSNKVTEKAFKRLLSRLKSDKKTLDTDYAQICYSIESKNTNNEIKEKFQKHSLSTPSLLGLFIFCPIKILIP